MVTDIIIWVWYLACFIIIWKAWPALACAWLLIVVAFVGVPYP